RPRRVKFSVALPSAYEGLGYPIGMVRDPAVFARLARAAESLGYDAVWANDHLSTPRFLRGAGGGRPSFYEPLVTLAHLAAVTARIGLGTAVLVLPRGRLVAGVGLGAYPEELAAVRPGRAGPRAARFDELLAALRTLLDEGGGTYRGRTVRFADVELAPAPLQRPLPLYIGGHGTEAVARAARWGQGWMPGWRPLGELRERVALLR